MNLRQKLVHYGQETLALILSPYSPNFPVILCLSIHTQEKHAVMERELCLNIESFHLLPSIIISRCDLFLTSLSFLNREAEITRTNKDAPVGVGTSGRLHHWLHCRPLERLCIFLTPAPAFPRLTLSLSPQCSHSDHWPCPRGFVCLFHQAFSSLMAAAQ